MSSSFFLSFRFFTRLVDCFCCRGYIYIRSDRRIVDTYIFFNTVSVSQQYIYISFSGILYFKECCFISLFIVYSILKLSSGYKHIIFDFVGFYIFQLVSFRFVSFVCSTLTSYIRQMTLLFIYYTSYFLLLLMFCYLKFVYDFFMRIKSNRI